MDGSPLLEARRIFAMFPLLGLLQFIPAIVTGIQHIHGDAVSGATKKQLALEALGLASNVATGGLVPARFQPQVQQFTKVASDAIDLTVAGYNAAGWPDKAVAKSTMNLTVGKKIV